MTKANPSNRIISSRLIIFLAAMALAELSRTMTMVQISVFLRELGASIQQIGFFFTITLIFPLLLRIFGGWISDTIGPLRALTIGSTAGMLGFAAYTLAPSWQFAILAPAFLAATSALIFPSYKAYIADQTSDDVRGRVFGLSETAINLAWILGPLVGGFIAQNLGYRWMFALSTLTYAMATLIFLGLFRTHPESITQDEQKLTLSAMRSSFNRMFILMLSGGLVTWILIVDGVRDVAFKLSFDLMPIYLSEIGGISKQGIGFLDGLFGIALALTTLPAGWLVDKTSERFGITMGLITVILSRLVFILALAFWGFASSWILLGVGVGLMEPAASSLIAKGVPRRVRGMAYGLVATSLGIISLPAPWIGSQLWKWINPQAPFYLTVVLGLFTIIPAWFKLRIDDKNWVGVEVHPTGNFLDDPLPEKMTK
jgi:MFS family permease